MLTDTPHRDPILLLPANRELVIAVVSEGENYQKKSMNESENGEGKKRVFVRER